jgi:hypothetical protein
MQIVDPNNLFGGPDFVSEEDQDRLAPHLASWAKLNELLVSDIIEEEDLKKMLLLEFYGNQRRQMIEKLVGRLSTKQRDRILGLL